MLLIKSKPETLLNNGLYRSSFNSLLNTLLEEPKQGAAVRQFVPAADITESETEFVIRLSLPGIKKEDVTISLDGELLNIEGERKKDLNAGTEKILRTEIASGKFSRSFNLGRHQHAAIDAKLEDGILSVKISKPAAEKSTLIEVK